MCAPGHGLAMMPTDKYVNLWNLVSERIRSEITRRPPEAR